MTGGLPSLMTYHRYMQLGCPIEPRKMYIYVHIHDRHVNFMYKRKHQLKPVKQKDLKTKLLHLITMSKG